MKKPQAKIAAISLIFFGISACSSMDGNWPSLADPLPDASERVRVIERANPTMPNREAPESMLTRSTAFKLLESTKARMEKAKEEYIAAKAGLSGLSGEDALDQWNEAQLALTRVSHTLSRLDQILITESLEDAPVWQSASNYKDQEDRYLVQERAALSALRPQ